ncbi:alpha/beta hydrolase [soil metagenome]
MLLALEKWLLFHPTPASVSWDPPPSKRVQDIELHLADGTFIHGWWFPTVNWKPEDGATLYLHGNAGNLSHRGGVAERWQREMNQAVLMIDYAGFGKSGGAPSEAGCVAAADAAYDWVVHERGVSPHQIMLYGGSLGGAIAVDLASRHDHRVLILVNTFASIPDMASYLFPYAPAGYFVRNKFDSMSKIPLCSRPIFQVHRTGDGVVPFEQGKRLFDHAIARKLFITVQGDAHDEAIADGIYDRFRRFLQEVETPDEADITVSGHR